MSIVKTWIRRVMQRLVENPQTPMNSIASLKHIQGSAETVPSNFPKSSSKFATIEKQRRRLGYGGNPTGGKSSENDTLKIDSKPSNVNSEGDTMLSVYKSPAMGLEKAQGAIVTNSNNAITTSELVAPTLDSDVKPVVGFNTTSSASAITPTADQTRKYQNYRIAQQILDSRLEHYANLAQRHDKTLKVDGVSKALAEVYKLFSNNAGPGFNNGMANVGDKPVLLALGPVRDQIFSAHDVGFAGIMQEARDKVLSGQSLAEVRPWAISMLSELNDKTYKVAKENVQEDPASVLVASLLVTPLAHAYNAHVVEDALQAVEPPVPFDLTEDGDVEPNPGPITLVAAGPSMYHLRTDNPVTYDEVKEFVINKLGEHGISLRWMTGVPFIRASMNDRAALRLLSEYLVVQVHSVGVNRVARPEFSTPESFAKRVESAVKQSLGTNVYLRFNADGMRPIRVEHFTDETIEHTKKLLWEHGYSICLGLAGGGKESLKKMSDQEVWELSKYADSIPRPATRTLIPGTVVKNWVAGLTTRFNNYTTPFAYPITEANGTTVTLTSCGAGTMLGFPWMAKVFNAGWLEHSAYTEDQMLRHENVLKIVISDNADLNTKFVPAPVIAEINNAVGNSLSANFTLNRAVGQWGTNLSMSYYINRIAYASQSGTSGRFTASWVAVSIIQAVHRLGFGLDGAWKAIGSEDPQVSINLTRQVHRRDMDSGAFVVDNVGRGNVLVIPQRECWDRLVRWDTYATTIQAGWGASSMGAVHFVNPNVLMGFYQQDTFQEIINNENIIIIDVTQSTDSTVEAMAIISQYIPAPRGAVRTIFPNDGAVANAPDAWVSGAVTSWLSNPYNPGPVNFLVVTSNQPTTGSFPTIQFDYSQPPGVGVVPPGTIIPMVTGWNPAAPAFTYAVNQGASNLMFLYQSFLKGVNAANLRLSPGLPIDLTGNTGFINRIAVEANKLANYSGDVEGYCAMLWQIGCSYGNAVPPNYGDDDVACTPAVAREWNYFDAAESGPFALHPYGVLNRRWNLINQVTIDSRISFPIPPRRVWLQELVRQKYFIPIDTVVTGMVTSLLDDTFVNYINDIIYSTNVLYSLTPVLHLLTYNNLSYGLALNHLQENTGTAAIQQNNDYFKALLNLWGIGYSTSEKFDFGIEQPGLYYASADRDGIDVWKNDVIAASTLVEWYEFLANPQNVPRLPTGILPQETMMVPHAWLGWGNWTYSQNPEYSASIDGTSEVACPDGLYAPLMNDIDALIPVTPEVVDHLFDYELTKYEDMLIAHIVQWHFTPDGAAFSLWYRCNGYSDAALANRVAIFRMVGWRRVGAGQTDYTSNSWVLPYWNVNTRNPEVAYLAISGWGPNIWYTMSNGQRIRSVRYSWFKRPQSSVVSIPRQMPKKLLVFGKSASTASTQSEAVVAGDPVSKTN